MKNNKLLIVDDDEIILEVLKATLSERGYQIVTSTNPEKAFDLYMQDPTLVVIFDLNMAEMSGKDLMLKIFEAGHKPIVIILTADTEIKTVVELFKIGVHDYLVKPFNSAELISRVSTAFEIAELRIINENLKKEREIRIEHQLNWNLFKENLIKKDSDKIDSGLMTNTNTSLIQGAGLGTLAPLVQLIKDSSKLENNNYIVEKDLMDMLFENTQFSNKLIFMIGDIDYVINNELPKEPLTIAQVHNIIESTIAENSEYENLRNHLVRIAGNTFASNSRKLNINSEYFSKAIQELLMNAYKFSEANSKIYILFEIRKDTLEISFLNTPEKDTKEQHGIPAEYQNIIFEPFFRISKMVYDTIPTLDFGLGLCYVEKIIRNHKGNIRVSNLTNYLENTNKILINFNIELPFIE